VKNQDPWNKIEEWEVKSPETLLKRIQSQKEKAP